MATKHILPTLSSTALLILMASCSTEEGYSTRTRHDASIIPTATIKMASTSSRANELSEPVLGTKFPKNKKNIFAVTAYNGDTVPAKNYNITYFYNQPVSSGSNEMAFNTPQYYPPTKKLYFYAYSPVMPEAQNGIGYKTNNLTAPSVTFDISDKRLTDILWAKDITGIAWTESDTLGINKEQPSFAFEHKLQQLRFKFVQSDNSVGSKVKKISIIGNPTSQNDEGNKTKGTAILNLINGEMTYEGENREYKLENLSYDIKAANNAQEIDKYFLIRPIQNIMLTLTYETNLGNTIKSKTFTKNVTLDGAQTDIGGKSYLLTIKFSSKPGLDVIVSVEEDYKWHECKLDDQDVGQKK